MCPLRLGLLQGILLVMTYHRICGMQHPNSTLRSEMGSRADIDPISHVDKLDAGHALKATRRSSLGGLCYCGFVSKFGKCKRRPSSDVCRWNSS